MIVHRTFDPGRVTIRRLNRTEYNNTIRDLIGIDFHPADDFPSDDVGYGFDNIGDVLSMPPILMEKYLAAAETISEEAIVVEPSAKGLVKSYTSRTWVPMRAGQMRGDGTIGLSSAGEIGVNHSFPRNGHYVIRVRASGDQAGPEPVKIAVRIDGKDLKRFDVTAPSGKFQNIEFKQNLRGGPRRLSVAFLNDYYKPDDPDPEEARSQPDSSSRSRSKGRFMHRVIRCPSRIGGSSSDAQDQSRRADRGPGDPRKVRQPGLSPAGHRG